MPRASAEKRIEQLLDRSEIFYLIRFERLCRDIKDWDGLVGSYVPGSPVRATWFDGTIEEFTEASKVKMGAGSGAKHRIFPAKLHQKGDRAICESPAYISERLTFEGIEFDVMTHVRFHSRVVLTNNAWRSRYSSRLARYPPGSEGPLGNGPIPENAPFPCHRAPDGRANRQCAPTWILRTECRSRQPPG